MASKKTILFLIPPASGHLNPCVSIAGEMNKRNDIHIVFLGSKLFQNLIEKSGSEFIEYADPEYDDIAKSVGNNHSPFITLKKMIKAADKVFPQILQICEERKPAAVIYDFFTYHGRYLFYYIEKNKSNLKFPVPKEILVSSSFAQAKGLFPPEEIIKGFMSKLQPNDEIYQLQNEINNKFGLDYQISLEKIFTYSDGLNICFLFEEFQPKAELLKQFYHFVGPCISEQVRNFSTTNEKLKQFLDTFHTVNPNYDNSKTSKDDLKLIYVSLGTIFNFNDKLFDQIIESFHNFERHDGLKLNNIRVIISLGQKTYDLFQNKIKNDNYRVHENILLLPTAPQVEILKRASLFITHAGMNSAIESIKYGVPMICLPQFADQPIVARRICDQLNLGIRLDSFSSEFSAAQLTKSVLEILTDKKYSENILKFAKILESESNNGCVNASNLVINYIK
jgi:UDP:flavonoid glycosyltransferase YjiC (YdhE family)